MKPLRFFISCLALVTLLSAPAGAQYVIKDSVYFTMDDGEMSPEEMEEEAEFVNQNCRNNNYLATYFDCECLGGSFLLQREKLGPTVLQHDILDKLTRGRGAKCPNPERIAGSAYANCMQYTATYRQLRKDNPEMCECTANAIAKEFTRFPNLNEAYINDLTARKTGECQSRFDNVYGQQ